jgi:hypothetical protein
MRAIFYRGELRAIAASERVFLAPAIEALSPREPLRRFVAALCLYSRDIDTGELPGPFIQPAAELYARSFLVADEEFEPYAGEDDLLLSRWFGLPLEQVAAKRSDLAARPADCARRSSAAGGGQHDGSGACRG